MGFMIMGIMGVIYAAFTLSAVFLRGRIGFAVWLVVSLLAVAFLITDLPPDDGGLISPTWFVTAAIIGFLVGIAIHILRAATRNILLPLILIVATPILLVNNLQFVEMINSLVSTL